MARRGGALTDYVERFDLCADWRPGRGSHYFLARANRWRAQLGLSLLLAARCSADFARVTARRLSRGSYFVAPMVIACHCGKPGPNANDLRRQRRASP